ncbi:UDP-glucose:undecaprenyl-phosphate glucose-1-phosphate transferase [Paenibacillus sp. CECT 9249]|uniref:sugar transferase n=1 Tax=Paenibacillus sp. CECT 9249 TaxID=2845385 RepID=UPI001E3F9743|nr:sugar transferase [Paenibacillus sp. CECT 9249]CAH0121703.1 UDP-glucose:undecaprenyl-phosphate glucose-1-phosphate transferase [Paenibacillus sp. CECT 9249]
MNAQVQINKTNLILAEHIASHKKKIVRTERMINAALIGLEYVLYIACFIVLFMWRVMPDYPGVDADNLIGGLSQITVLNDYMILLGFIFIIYSVIMFQKGLYRFNRSASLIDDMSTIVKAIAISFLIALGFAFFLKTSFLYSRVVILMFSVSMLASAMLIRSLKLIIVVQLKKSKMHTRNVLIIGAGKVGADLSHKLTGKKTIGYHFVGFLDDYKKGGNILGQTRDLEKVIQRNKVHEIYITIPSERALIHRIISTIRKYDIQIKVIPEMFELVATTVNFDKTYDYAYIEIVKTPLRGVNLVLKRCIDFILSGVGLALLSPLLCIVALLIKIDSKGPVFFKQKRIGKSGSTFHMYKFRSMIYDAEEMKKKLERHNEATGPVFKMKNDPRVTRIGRFIRKYSIDELPQLFNVLRGEMSLIGPRPPLPEEVERYTDQHWIRLDVLPGITGLWQVSGRSDLTFEEWVNLDIYYIEKWSVSLDIKILLKTIPVVLKGEGAY